MVRPSSGVPRHVSGGMWEPPIGTQQRHITAIPCRPPLLNINHLSVELLWHYMRRLSSIWSQRVLFILSPHSLIFHGCSLFHFSAVREEEGWGGGHPPSARNREECDCGDFSSCRVNCVISTQTCGFFFSLRIKKGYLAALPPLLLHYYSPN